ncbi:MAG: hypothetical protein E6G39_02865 [Actinobacteria bacterium]|nr:MAG: hypothetical protein E6G39_02865 [Actinomycetota bacterium]
MRRAWAYIISVSALALVFSPVLRPSQRDSYPLSTYPMFSDDLGRESALPTAVGVTADGRVRRLSPELISGGYEPVRAYATVQASIANGDTAQLCSEIAQRAVDHRTPDVIAIEVVTEVHDVVTWFEGQKEPLQRIVHARCSLDVGPVATR